jgi:hypothetical protein
MMRVWFFAVSVLIYFYVADSSTFTTWESLSVGLFVFFILDFLNRLGKKMVIFDILIVLAILTCLIMPIWGYHVYTKSDRLAHLWVKYMFIPSDEYFSFAFPAVVAMILGFRIPLARKSNVEKNPAIYMERMKEEVKKKPNVGMILIGVGLVSGIFTKFVPGGLTQFFLFLSRLIYVGVFYVMYSPHKQKSKIVIGVFCIMIGESLVVGMFGELIFTSVASAILIMLGKKVPFYKKLTFALVGFYFILLLQSIKIEYRRAAWSGEGGGPVYFAQLIGERVADPALLLEPKNSFLTYVRLNQGWLVGTTIFFVPHRYPFANGETIWESIAAAIVPRLFWPNKPEAGGRANLKRFWGYKLKGYSENIGPLGEAYGNFGVTGGIIYMFFFGLFFNFLLKKVLKKADDIPTLILWVPFLFSGTLTVESDLLTVLGVIIKGLFFTWLIFKIFKAGFHIDL